MRGVFKGAIMGAAALCCLAAVPEEAAAMPVGLSTTSLAGASQDSGLQQIYWRYVYRRPFVYGWRRPFYGLRRPFFYGRPYRRFYRW